MNDLIGNPTFQLGFICALLLGIAMWFVLALINGVGAAYDRIVRTRMAAQRRNEVDE